MSDFSFTKEGVERPVDNDFAPLPAGEYPAMIEKTEWTKAFGDPTGPDHLKLTVVIIDGEFKNRKVWKKLHLHSADTSEKKKATGVLAQLLDAIELNGIQNTAELCNKPFTAKLTIFTPPTPGSKPMNVVNTFLPMGVTKAPAIGQAVGQEAKKPWG